MMRFVGESGSFTNVQWLPNLTGATPTQPERMQTAAEYEAKLDAMDKDIEEATDAMKRDEEQAAVRAEEHAAEIAALHAQIADGAAELEFAKAELGACPLPCPSRSVERK